MYEYVHQVLYKLLFSWGAPPNRTESRSFNTRFSNGDAATSAHAANMPIQDLSPARSGMKATVAREARSISPPKINRMVVPASRKPWSVPIGRGEMGDTGCHGLDTDGNGASNPIVCSRNSPTLLCLHTPSIEVSPTLFPLHEHICNEPCRFLP